ncbi:MAG: ATP-binding cassette domain-containing protein [Lautropia sp.]
MSTALRRRWLAPEVVQTSAMDCGPAALKCVLEGFGVRASYARLREACQTDLDGTSIDTIESIANALGVHVEQVLLPVDIAFLETAGVVPGLFIVTQSDGAAHFLVVWRRVGPWVQVMDPASGRRWMSWRRLQADLFRHEMSVPATEWRSWAASEPGLAPLRRRIASVGAPDAAAERLVAQALQDPGWFALGVLDACVRLVQSISASGAVRRGWNATNLLASLYRRTIENPRDIHAIIPPSYWSVTPDPSSEDRANQRLLARGAVLLRVLGRRSPEPAARADAGVPALSRELQAALSEPSARPWRTLWSMLRADGLLSPLALIGAMSIAVGAVAVETLLFRGIFDMLPMLNLPAQRHAAVAALLGFVGILWLIRVPIASESMRLGRHLDTRLRMALLAKLPRLSDRYFHSRPISDMAERSHSIQLSRMLPGMGLHFIQANGEMVLVVAGIAWLAPASLPLALALAGVAVLVPMLMQPLLNERELRARQHAAAMNGTYLDAMLGLVPVRVHRAERAVRRLHEGLLVEWSRSARSLLRLSMLAQGVPAVLCAALASTLLVNHLTLAGGIGGSDLLLVYWTLKLPGIGGQLAGLARQYPVQRNVLLRLLEPLTSPSAEPPAETTGAAAPTPASASAVAGGAIEGRRVAGLAGGDPSAPGGLRIDIEAGSVVAGGHTILDELTLSVRPGEHVAIVGASGAGKSTLVGVLLGWHRLSTGVLRIDDAPVDGAIPDELRRRTAWVDPGIQLWNRPLLANLTFACEDDGPGNIAGVLDAAALRDVLLKLPEGLQTWLGEGGALLSGGEGQRVRLARALLQRRVRLALLDEPFRGMDRQQRRELLGDARRWWRDATLLCVTHDIAETLAFDRVLVVHDGRLVEDGEPLRLLAADTRYRDLIEAERAVHGHDWMDDRWRRLRIVEGRVVDATAQDGRRARGVLASEAPGRASTVGVPDAARPAPARSPTALAARAVQQVGRC